MKPLKWSPLKDEETEIFVTIVITGCCAQRSRMEETASKYGDKVKLHAIKTHQRLEVELHAFLTWALDGGE
jgi:hypothetical protein